ncbi:MAG: hypothetical protein E7558_06010 [Ruminococcaceae bacterium]|nr:hypothetical protein [Oscillospiraceae bacterium]
MNSKVRIFLAIVLVVVCCYVSTLAFPSQFNVNVTVKGGQQTQSGTADTNKPAVQTPVQTPQASTPNASDKTEDKQEADKTDKNDKTDKEDADKNEGSDSKGIPSTTEEIIDKYVFLVNKVKADQPAYKKKEFQSLPEEYRNLGSVANLILDLAAGYMTTEEECEEIVREKGAGTINNEMPIYGSDKGSVLTDYDAVAWAKCEPLGDGTYEITFSLKEEKNCEPTPAETLVPSSAHGAVMSPLSKKDIQVEVDKVTGSVPGLTVNSFDLTYRDGVFGCVYDPATDQVSSITHHCVIDIEVDIDMFVANINGSARLLNEMLIYDITW